MKEIPQVLRNIAYEWHDGPHTMMYKFSRSFMQLTPSEYRVLNKEIDAALKEARTTVQINELSQLSDYVQTEVACARAKRAITQALDKAISLSVTPDEIRTIVEEFLTRNARVKKSNQTPVMQ